MVHYLEGSLFVKFKIYKTMFRKIKIWWLKLKLLWISLKIKALNDAQNKKIQK